MITQQHILAWPGDISFSLWNCLPEVREKRACSVSPRRLLTISDGDGLPQ